MALAGRCLVWEIGWKMAEGMAVAVKVMDGGMCTDVLDVGQWSPVLGLGIVTAVTYNANLEVSLAVYPFFRQMCTHVGRQGLKRAT